MAKNRIEENKRLLRKCMNDIFTKNITAAGRESVAHNLISKIHGLKAKEVSELYKWASDYTKTWEYMPKAKRTKMESWIKETQLFEQIAGRKETSYEELEKEFRSSH